jgi:hypothetical protein
VAETTVRIVTAEAPVKPMLHEADAGTLVKNETVVGEPSKPTLKLADATTGINGDEI